jgi:DNA-binding response OmpR family regulator
VNVLVIDDDPLAAESLAELLRARGHAAFWAADVDGGVAKVGQLPPDVVIFDAAMPSGGGLLAVASVRCKPGWSGVPAIVLTALSGQDLDAVVTAASFMSRVTVLRKPADLSQVIDCMNRLSEGRPC